MQIVETIFRIVGSLALFLYGMKVMSDGIQQAAGDRLQRILGFMTGNRLSAVLTGVGITGIIQSSSATTVMVVSFVNAGLLTLKQAIGVIMGANVGTTVTAWIVSLIGFSINVSSLALPAIGIGFVMYIVKWKHKDVGVVFMGFGLLFLGLDFLTKSMPILTPEGLAFIGSYSDMGFLSTLLGAFIGLVITLLIHSSSASTAIVITMAHGGIIGFPMAGAMILGANIGTTIDAALASIGTKTSARRAALVHVLFNVFGTVWALCLFRPFCDFVILITPDAAGGSAIATRLAMFHTIFNAANTIVLFPFVDQLAKIVSVLIKNGKDEPVDAEGPYRLIYKSGSIQNTPEFNIYRAEKEIRDMAGLASAMYTEFKETLRDMTEENVRQLVSDLSAKKTRTNEMRAELNLFLIECARHQLNYRSERNISQMIRIIADIADISYNCHSIGLILERSVKTGHIFNPIEIEKITPLSSLVGNFLNFVHSNLGHRLSEEQHEYAESLENKIGKSRDKLRKVGRKRIQAGEDVKTELLFIDLVRHIEKLGDYCYNISEALQQMV